MIHSSRRDRKAKAIAEVLAMIADAYPPRAPHGPRPPSFDIASLPSAIAIAQGLHISSAARLKNFVTHHHVNHLQRRRIVARAFGSVRCVMPRVLKGERRAPLAHRSAARDRPVLRAGRPGEAFLNPKIVQ
jgi:hypothetical protein